MLYNGQCIRNNFNLSLIIFQIYQAGDIFFNVMFLLTCDESSYLAVVAEVNCLNLTALLLVLVLAVLSGHEVATIIPAPLLITVAAGMPAVIVTIPPVPATIIAPATAALIFPIALCVLIRRALLIPC